MVRKRDHVQCRSHKLIKENSLPSQHSDQKSYEPSVRSTISQLVWPNRSSSLVFSHLQTYKNVRHDVPRRDQVLKLHPSTDYLYFKTITSLDYLIY